jgi:hypothetical protein
MFMVARLTEFHTRTCGWKDTQDNRLISNNCH